MRTKYKIIALLFLVLSSLIINLQKIEDSLINSYRPRVAKKVTTFEKNSWSDVHMLNITTVIRQYFSNSIPANGALYIPELTLNVPIINASNNNIYAMGAGTLYKTQLNGTDRVILGAHNLGPQSTALFSKVYYHTHIHQYIYITNFKKLTKYQVTSMSIINSHAVKKVNNIEPTDLELLTCTPDNNHRLRVVARKIFTKNMSSADSSLRKEIIKKYRF